MRKLDKMLYEAKILDARTREHKPCYFVEVTEAGKWVVRGSNRLFDTEAQAVDFCQECAGERHVGIIVCDIPYSLPDGDVMNTCGITEAEAMKELTENGVKGTS